jgi:4-hydroxyacetophenone monooxygenase
MDKVADHLSVVVGAGAAGPGVAPSDRPFDTLPPDRPDAEGKPDRTHVRRALELADHDAVRIAMYHLTGDARFKALPTAANLSEEQRDWLIETATDWLEANASQRLLPEPPEANLREMMEMAVGGPMGDLEFAARRDLPGFSDFPFMVDWPSEPPEIPLGFKVVIIGSGFAGVGMGVQLGRLGIPYEIFERRADPGGVWSINRYPDVRVDTSSITYEFMFEKEHIWDEYFGRGGDVQGYIERVSRKFGVFENTRFGHDVTSARFDEGRNLWVVEVSTPDGTRTVEANAIISCTGLYANPNIPDFVGAEDFKGRILHPSRWDPTVDLRGKRVAMIGNGSTGVQMLGTIARQAEQVYAVQRTPQWIMPRARYGESIEPEVSWLLRNFPGYRNWWRFTSTAPLFDTHQLMQVDEEWQAQGGQVNRGSDTIRRELLEYIKVQTGGRQDLIAKLTPDYAPMSRRPVVDNGFYKALTRDNVELVTDPITGLVPDGIQTPDGKVRAVDIIISATGFHVEQYLWPTRIVGKAGVDLHRRWNEGDGPRAYIGMMMPDFPNMFVLYGPNSQPVSGGPAQPVWFATWGSFVAQCLMRMIECGASQVEVKAEAFERYNEALDREAGTLVQMTAEGGIDRNYYVNQDHARLQVNAPWYSPHYYQLCSQVNWDDVAMSGTLR